MTVQSYQQKAPSECEHVEKLDAPSFPIKLNLINIVVSPICILVCQLQKAESFN